MKNLLLAGVAVFPLFAAHPSSAADLGTRPILKAPPMAPVFSWTGCFVGGQLGWGWQRNNISDSVDFTSSSRGLHAGSGSVDTNGPVFGGQVGCDYQFVGSQFVIGVQGMALAADIDGKGNDPLNGIFGDENSISIDSSAIFSATGRLGFTGWMPQTMFYVRGGAAWMRTQYDLTLSELSGINRPNAALFDANHSGWTIGGGVEWMFLANWSAFLEYNFYRFNTFSVTETSCCPTVSTFSSQPDVSTVTVGLNYRFGMH
jgi:outer membrane immunogenic protein